MGSSNPESNVHIGDFRIEERLGAGGMGIVYRARQLSLDRDVALKVLGSALSRDSDIARFQREAQAAARLKHPNIASIYFIGQDEQTCYIAMELIDGVSLDRVIERLAESNAEGTTLDSVVAQECDRTAQARPLRFDSPTVIYLEKNESNTGGNARRADHSSSMLTTCRSAEHVRRCCEVVRDSARALSHAHEQGVVHRDVKPANILMDTAGQPHIIDFGIARFFDDVSLTFTGQLVGTPMYMSPEQVTGRIEVDLRTDIYSLGLVLYELLTLRSAVQAPTREQLLRRIITKPLPPVSWLNPAIGRDLESIVHKATQKDPDERYQSATAMVEDLERYLTHKPVTATGYQYRFDKREIVAARPGGVLVAAVLFFLASTVCAMLAAMMGSMMIFSLSAPKKLLTVAAQLGLAVGCVAVGVNLLSARGWARWAAAIIALLIISFSTIMVFSMIITMTSAFVVPVETPDGVDRESVRASVIGSLLPTTGVFVCGIVAGIFMLVVLFQRKTRDWFRLASDVRREHFRVRRELTDI